jgi:hypothetical protein
MANDQETNVDDSAATNCYAAFRHLLGERVKTADGIGILIGVMTPFNGGCCRPEQILLTVWYPQETRQWITSWTYRPEDVSEA